jgi:hypothetical protein
MSITRSERGSHQARRAKGQIAKAKNGKGTWALGFRVPEANRIRVYGARGEWVWGLGCQRQMELGFMLPEVLGFRV